MLCPTLRAFLGLVPFGVLHKTLKPVVTGFVLAAVFKERHRKFTLEQSQVPATSVVGHTLSIEGHLHIETRTEARLTPNW